MQPTPLIDSPQEPFVDILADPLGYVAGYRLEAVIGRGASSTVFRARQSQDRRLVALKLFERGAAEADARQRFRREARLHALVDHPCVVPIYDAGTARRGMFLTMKLVHGPNLRDLVRTGEIDETKTLGILRRVAAALDRVHDLGLVHRDIKPSNVLVDRLGQAFLADFGLTREMGGEALTRSGAITGTVAYMAPEVIAGMAAGPPADRYSFAAMAFELLAGEPPFVRPVDAAVLFAHMSDSPPRISDLREELPGRLDGVFARALGKSPDERFSSATAIVDVIAEATLRCGREGPMSWPLSRSDDAMRGAYSTFAHATLTTSRGESSPTSFAT